MKDFFYIKQLSYCTETVSHDMLIMCYISGRARVRKVSESKRYHEGHSR